MQDNAEYVILRDDNNCTVKVRKDLADKYILCPGCTGHSFRSNVQSLYFNPTALSYGGIYQLWVTNTHRCMTCGGTGTIRIKE